MRACNHNPTPHSDRHHTIKLTDCGVDQKGGPARQYHPSGPQCRRLGFGGPHPRYSRRAPRPPGRGRVCDNDRDEPGGVHTIFSAATTNCALLNLTGHFVCRMPTCPQTVRLFVVILAVLTREGERENKKSVSTACLTTRSRV